ncbi:MAG: Glu/Leu/Phe/Val dehydrogenase [Gemmataceae bacterium]|nr:Glu/Leu/Phe/Val dehydrogenase [Gemmataceae bacterium]
MPDIFDEISTLGHEQVVLCSLPEVGLRAIIAGHDTTLGPAGGGLRMWQYADDRAALTDALRLSRGMTYKYAAAGLNLGGGKAVIIGDPKTQKTEGLIRAFGRFMSRMGGLYLTGEDVGITLEDLVVLRSETPYVITMPEENGGVGPIAPATAVGTLEGIKAAVEAAYGTPDIKGKRAAVQGVGAVGGEVVRELVNAGAVVTATDIDAARLEAFRKELGIEAVSPDAIYDVDCEIFSPCALGATINEQTLPRLKAKVIAGCANNQLATPAVGDEVYAKGIIYAPDYIINAGGATIDADRLQPGGFNRERAMVAVRAIGGRVAEALRISRDENVPSYIAADRLAERRLAAMRAVNSLSSGPRWSPAAGLEVRR